MYSCHVQRQEIVQLKTISFKGFESAKFCRFDLRYDPLHQKAGCSNCTKEWDVAYLKSVGLYKDEGQAEKSKPEAETKQ